MEYYKYVWTSINTNPFLFIAHAISQRNPHTHTHMYTQILSLLYVFGRGEFKAFAIQYAKYTRLCIYIYICTIR